MKTHSQAIRIGLCALAFGANATAQAAEPVITSFSGNGVLVCSNLVPGSVVTVEWASSLPGPWTNNWAGLEAVTVNSNGTIQVGVPMFYRVRRNSLSPGMALIPPGFFTMGNCMDPGEGGSEELPLHTVYVSAFYMDTNLISYALWQQVYQWATNNGYNFDYAGSGKAANHPVVSINWYDVVKWCNARSEMENLVPAYYTSEGQTNVYRTGTNNLENSWVKWNTGYRLPTEAEWEKAARGGASGRRFPWSDVDTIQHSQANYYSTNKYAYDTSPTRGYHPTFATGDYPYTSPVGYFAPNGYGLYDMAGNVWESCWDWYSSTYYISSPGTDPRGPASSASGGRMLRGGSWYELDSVRCAVRAYRAPSFAYYHYGFRCVRGL